MENEFPFGIAVFYGAVLVIAALFIVGLKRTSLREVEKKPPTLLF